MTEQQIKDTITELCERERLFKENIEEGHGSRQFWRGKLTEVRFMINKLTWMLGKAF